MRKLGTRGSYRLREPDKFKGHLEFALKLKWLDIESIQQSVHGVVICAPMTAFWATTKVSTWSVPPPLSALGTSFRAMSILCSALLSSEFSVWIF